MADFLLELRCEEIPARMQPKAKEDLARLFAEALAKAGLTAGQVETFATPRRLSLIATGLPLATSAVSEETKGPKVGAPPQALEGFLRKVGLAADQLTERDGVWFAVVEKPGRDTAEVLAEAVPAIIRAFPWPKSMRWGAGSLSTESLRWVRPLSGIIALLDGAVVPFEVDGIASGRTTMGHRFHHSGPVEIADAGSYIETLRAAHVIVHFSERCRMIREGAARAAAEAGLTLVEDEGLVIENAGLTEWPVPLLGRFDEAFLDVPPEVIQLTARVNQKYFVCEDAQGKLANAFVCTANIEPRDPAVVVDGNRKVLAARLSDARFFWEQDQKTPLAVHAEKLARITFHEKLGTVADKVERVAKLARWLCEEGIILPGTGRGTSVAGGGASGAAPTAHLSDRGSSPLHHPVDGPPPLAGEDRARLADLAEQAARLAKADLVTEMVGEFPELQGLMGGYYAAKEGLPVEVAEAIRDHYKPVGQGDDVPTAPVTVAVSLADKLDNVFQMFSILEEPTGSKDPFALRRAAIGVNLICLLNDVRLNIIDAVLFSGVSYANHKANWTPEFASEARRWVAQLSDRVAHIEDETQRIASALSIRLGAKIFSFFGQRMIAQLKAEGKRPDFIEAVLYSDAGNVPAMVARANALQAFIGTEDGTNLLAGYKRAANILKKEGYEGPTGTPDPEVLASLKQNNDGIPDTGEEDPLALVDDPDVGDILAAEARREPGLGYAPEPAEQALIDALAAAAPRAAAAVEAERFAEAMAALATLRAPIDRFFDEVTVNADEADKRQARLALLARFRDAVHRVADFSRIEG